MRWLSRRPAAAADDAQPGTGELLAAAERFITLFHDENPGAGASADRMRQVRAEIGAHGTYRHTPSELEFAARVAWRNSSRCIGRLYWRTLRARDRRQGSAAGQIPAGGLHHLHEAPHHGGDRRLIRILPPDAPG